MWNNWRWQDYNDCKIEDYIWKVIPWVATSREGTYTFLQGVYIYPYLQNYYILGVLHRLRCIEEVFQTPSIQIKRYIRLADMKRYASATLNYGLNYATPGNQLYSHMCSFMIIYTFLT